MKPNPSESSPSQPAPALAAPPAVTLDSLDAFTRAYITAALWSTSDESTPQGGEPLDSNYSPKDIAPETLAEIAADCARFQAENAEDIAEGFEGEGDDFTEQAGHDFWLTRNGHGSGFWDGEWTGGEDGTKMQRRGMMDRPENAGDRLTAAAHSYGEVNLYVGDDGKIWA